MALVAFSCSLPLTLPLSISWLGPWAGLGWVCAWLAALGVALHTRCPRCLRRFADGLVLPLNSYCRHCGVPQFAPPQLFGPFEDAAKQVSPSLPEAAPEVSRRVRRWIGGGQVAAGGVILATYGATMMRGVLGVWELWSRAGFAALAVIGGIALYRGQRSGYSLTRLVLAAQVLSFVLPGAAYEAYAGFYGGISFGTDGIRLNAGWMSNVLLWVGETTGWRIRLNVLALVLLALIPDPRPARDPAA